MPARAPAAARGRPRGTADRGGTGEMVLQAVLVALLLTVAPAVHGRTGVPDGPEQLRRSAEMGELEKVKKLILKEKVDVNSAPMFGETPLHWSSQSGHLEVVEELISLGGNVRCEISCTLAMRCCSASSCILGVVDFPPFISRDVNGVIAGKQSGQRWVHAVE
eukprot:COSAG02_NODE_772_length_17359_cov_74.661587_17_plen_163_part_00